MGIGQRIKRVAEERGMTLKEVAQKAGVSYNTIYSITKRDSERIQGSILQRISSALDISPSDLIDTDPGTNNIIGIITDSYPKASFSVDKDTKTLRLSLGSGDKKARLLQHFDSLSDEGQQKAVERVEELAEIPRYRRPDAPDEPQEPSEGE